MLGANGSSLSEAKSSKKILTALQADLATHSRMDHNEHRKLFT
jgi:hypothetical protein